jgi:ribosomal protein S18 acetylase RimI-like enzyme
MSPPGEVSVQPLTPARWDDLVMLFGPQGGYGHCWCTWWRQTGRDYGAGCENGGEGNRTLLKQLTDGGRRPGLLAYRGGAPVGWASVAPRPEFGRVLRSRMLGPDRDAAPDETTWSIVCFWIPRGERRTGVASALLRAAIREAARAGAKTLEAYPVDTQGKRHPSANLFTGTLGMYQAAGFREVERRSASRPIVQLSL